MKVNESVSQPGVAPDTDRYYPRIGLLIPARDAGDGCRHCKQHADVGVACTFSCAARAGTPSRRKMAQIFGMSDCTLTPCPIVREIAQRRIVDTRERLAEMQALARWAEMPDGELDLHALWVSIDATGFRMAGAAVSRC